MSNEMQSNKVLFADWHKAVAFNMDDGEVSVNLIAETGPIEFSVQRRIPYERMYDLCYDVAGLCIKDGVCHWEVFDLAVNYFIVSYFTNLDCDVPLEQVYELLHYTDVIDVIQGVIGKNMYQDVREMAKRTCKSSLGMQKNELEILAGRINWFLDDVEGQISTDGVFDEEKLNAILRSLDELSGGMKSGDDSNDYETSNVIEMERK